MAKQRKSMLQVRGGFSDTSGIAPCNTVIQYAEFDDRTRIQLSNYTFELLDTAFSPEHSFRIFKRDVSSPFCKDILGEVFSDTPRLANGYLYNWKKVFESKFDPVFVNAPYNEVLDLIYYNTITLLQQSGKRFLCTSSEIKEVCQFQRKTSLFCRFDSWI